MPLKIIVFLLIVFCACGFYYLLRFFGVSTETYLLCLLPLFFCVWFFRERIERCLYSFFTLSRPFSWLDLGADPSVYNNIHLIYAVDALQSVTSLDDVNLTVNETLRKVFNFTNIDIFYSHFYRKKLEGCPSIPCEYQALFDGPPEMSKHHQASNVCLVTAKTCNDNQIKSYLKKEKVSALLIFYHSDRLFCVIQARGRSGELLEKKFDEPLVHYLNIALQRIVYVRGVMEQEAIAQESQVRLMHSLAGSIAHEIRNPLNIINMILQIVQEQLPTQKNCSEVMCWANEHLDEVQEGFNDCFLTIRRARIVIDLILNNIRGEIDKKGFAHLSALTCLNAALREYVYQESEQVRVLANVEEDFIFFGDENLFVFIIFNLLKNSLYYVSNYPQLKISINVRLGVEVEGDRYNAITFEDDGPGIDADNIEKLFDHFFTAEKKEGVGLGLSFCQRTMQAFGGDIECESVKGEFTRFFLKFPVAG